jgi:anion-transporting  ArsA/GET3 family ATPase
LLDYLHDHGMRTIAKRLVASGALDAVSQAVPGMQDILVLGKVKQMERAGVADLIVVDAPAAGHAVSFLRSARGLLDSIRVGPIRKQAEDVTELLADPTRCRVVLVTLAEETPVAELTDTAFALEDAVGIALAPVVVNALVPAPPAAVAAGVGAVSSGSGSSGASGGGAAGGVGLDLGGLPAGWTAALGAHGVDAADAAAIHDAARALVGRHERQQAQVERLARSLPLEQLALPLRWRAALGPEDLAVLADALADGIERLPVPA